MTKDGTYIYIDPSPRVDYGADHPTRWAFALAIALLASNVVGGYALIKTHNENVQLRTHALDCRGGFKARPLGKVSAPALRRIEA